MGNDLNVYVKLFQMYYSKCCYGASNAVGYKNYPDNVIHKFVQESAKAGIDVLEFSIIKLGRSNESCQ
ncbi:pyruvate carboxylase [Staphylococcus aureus]|uniref:Pyruvate carboxylase n=1 Tax=Staphylococcus aureus TaxID=1280 RepID=A0A2X2M0P7_STAAU|nr:pyruvate carboxylase [Staphylococcus aureus]